MTLDEAKAILNECVHNQLVDRAFGDSEHHWTKNDEEVGYAYYGSSGSELIISIGTVQHKFTGDNAYSLMNCGKAGEYARNDGGSHYE